MHKLVLATLLLVLSFTMVGAQTVTNATHMVPAGKAWAVEDTAAAHSTTMLSSPARTILLLTRQNQREETNNE
ncbi:MAG TPA: hypothetical protein VMU45_10615 [Candidatus Eisenbacteria bacterium]|nr:hypothetical protein [Candidatus Eisenbacteria bacterium]